MPFFNLFWEWLVAQVHDPSVWFFFGPGFALIALVGMGVLLAAQAVHDRLTS